MEAFDASLRDLHEDGFCILRALFAPELVDRWRAACMPLLAEAMGRPPNRGPARWYADLPFASPFGDLIEHPTVASLIESLLGPDAVLLHLGSDTPALGSQTQDVHSDLPDLFPGCELAVPTYALAINLPLVDVDAGNGPFEVARGTHRLPPGEGRRRVAAGAIALEPLHLRRGDVLVRDPRTLHRGTACRSSTPRPVLVAAFLREWYRHDGFGPIAMAPAVAATLSDRARRLLRRQLEVASPMTS